MIPAGELLERAAALRRSSASVALAPVVRSKRPASARPGDRALVLADGSMEGWVGGSCAQTTIQREAQRALGDGKPRLVRLSPDARPDLDEEGVVSYPMTCHSGGTLEIYVEPFTPLPLLVVIGESPVSQALAALGPPLGFHVSEQVDAESLTSLSHAVDAWIVIAAMGDRDELAAEAALATDAPYVAIVASPRRALTVLEYLRAQGVSEAALSRLKAPAGLDIGATSGAEVALSILAEIVQRRRAMPSRPAAIAATVPATATDPVCDMEVEIASAKWTSARDGRTFYFCASGCKRRFDRDPSVYLTAS